MKRGRIGRRAALILAAALASGSTADAVNIPWNNAAGGNWNTPGNWTGGVPTSMDTAQFNSMAIYTVLLDISPSITGVTVAGSLVTLNNTTVGRTFTLSNALNVNTGSITLSSTTPFTMSTAVSSVLNSNVSVLTGNSLTMPGMTLGSTASAALLVSGAGSTLTCSGPSNLGTSAGGNGVLNLTTNAVANLAALNVANASGNASVSVQGGSHLTTSAVNVGTGAVAAQTGSLSVIGGGSTLTVNAASNFFIGGSANSTGTVSLSAGGSAAMGTGQLTLGSTGTLDIGLGSSFTTSGSVNVTNSSGSGPGGKITVGGAGANFTQSGATSLLVGNTTSGTGQIIVNPSGVFTTGAGQTTVNATGTINITGGTFNANGNISLISGQLNLSNTAGSTLTWAAGKAMTISSGGVANFATSYTTPANAVINISGASSQLTNTAGTFAVASGATINATTAGAINAAALTINDGSVTVDGVSSMLAATSLSINPSTVSGKFTLKNNAAANTGQIFLTSSSASGAASLNIETGAHWTCNGLISVGTSLGTATFTVTDVGSSLTQAGSNALQVGAGVPNSGTFNVLTKSIVTTGTGTLSVGAGGLVNVDGGTLNANGNIDVSGSGILQRTANVVSAFNWAAGKTMNVQSGGTVSLAGLFTGANETINISGGTSGLSNESAILSGAMNITTGATYSATGPLTLGASSPQTIVVDGAGSTFSASGASALGSSADATMTFKNQSDGSFGTLNVASTSTTNSSLSIQSGADVTSGVTTVATQGVAGQVGAINIDGVGSTMTIVPGGQLMLGAASNSPATLNITNGGILTNNAAAGTFLNATGVINITDATAQLGALTNTGGVIHFNSGVLNFIGSFSVGGGGLLGSNVTLDASRSLTLTGTTTIDASHTLTLNGGTLSTGSLVNNGAFNFTSGSLFVTGAGGLTIGSGSPLGANASIAAGQTLSVTNTLTIASTGLLLISNANVSTGAITNNGELHLDGPLSQTTGGFLTNSKLVAGDGRIANSLNNQAAGEVRVSGSDRLYFSGNTNTNSGKMNLLNGGTIEFSAALTNAVGATISGRGTLITGGLTNNGTMQLSGGFSDVFGNLTVTSGGKTIVTGGGVTSFYNAVTLNAGSELRVSDFATAIFFGNVAGAGNVSGGGTAIFESGSSLLTALDNPGSAIVQDGASLTANHIRDASLTVNGSVTIPHNGTNSGVSTATTLAVSGSGQLNLTNNKLITSSAPGAATAGVYTGVQGFVQRGYNEGTWDGLGIITSEPDALASKTTIGVATGAQIRGLGAGDTDLFAGQVITGTSTIAMYTYAGDANLDGTINPDDYANISFNDNIPSASGYYNGDFNYDGDINADDFALIDFNFNAQGAPFSTSSTDTVTAVPEPAAWGMVLAGWMGLNRRRRN